MAIARHPFAFVSAFGGHQRINAAKLFGYLIVLVALVLKRYLVLLVVAV